jgi:hypothetical protein
MHYAPKNRIIFYYYYCYCSSSSTGGGGGGMGAWFAMRWQLRCNLNEGDKNAYRNLVENNCGMWPLQSMRIRKDSVKVIAGETYYLWGWESWYRWSCCLWRRSAATRLRGSRVWIPSRALMIFRTRPDRPWGPASLLYDGYRVSFPGVKRPGLGVDHPPPSSAEVKERVELYF